MVTATETSIQPQGSEAPPLLIYCVGVMVLSASRETK
jgi:hypothetical protein